MNQLLEKPGARYLAASILALGLDYVLTLGLFHLTKVTLSVAAAFSFFTVGIAFYFVHEFWTFRSEGSAFSMARLGVNFAGLMAAGAVRVGVIALLVGLRAPEGIWVSVYIAAGVSCSFTTNFLLNRFFVFKR